MRFSTSSVSTMRACALTTDITVAACSGVMSPAPSFLITMRPWSASEPSRPSIRTGKPGEGDASEDPVELAGVLPRPGEQMIRAAEALERRKWRP